MRALVRVRLARLPERVGRGRGFRHFEADSWHGVSRARIPGGTGSRILCEEGGGAMNPCTAHAITARTRHYCTHTLRNPYAYKRDATMAQLMARDRNCVKNTILANLEGIHKLAQPFLWSLA